MRRDLIAIMPPRLSMFDLLVSVTEVLELLGATSMLLKRYSHSSRSVLAGVDAGYVPSQRLRRANAPSA